MTLGRPKLISRTGTRGNTIKLKFRGTCDHVTLMPTIYAAGQVITALFVLPGNEAVIESGVTVRMKPFHAFCLKQTLFYVPRFRCGY